MLIQWLYDFVSHKQLLVSLNVLEANCVEITANFLQGFFFTGQI